MAINPAFAKKYAEFKGITEADLKDAYGDDMTQIEADLKEEGLSVSDFGAPEPVAPPPVGSANDPNNHSARIKELMDYASSFDASGTPEAIGRVKAEANREIEKLHKKYGSGSVNQWVRSQLSGGATKRQNKLGAATDLLNSVFDPMERSPIAKNIRSAAGEFTEKALGHAGPALASVSAAKALIGGSDMADESLFGTLQGAAQKAALDRAVVKPADQLTDEEKAAVAADNTSAFDATKQAVGTLAEQVTESPKQFASQLAMDVLSPSNVAGEALTGPLGALTKRVAGASNAAQRARRLLDADPLVTGGSTYRRLPAIGAAARGATQVVEETAQGAFSEAAQTGDVTAAGTVTNIAPAAVGSVFRGATTPNAAKRTGNVEPPAAAQQPAVAPEPVAPVPEPTPVPDAAPVAPQSAPEAAPVAPTLRPSEARPYPQRGVQPRETDATRAAKKVARKEEAQAKSEAESQIAIHTKKAKEFAKAGMQADAEALLDKSRAHYDKVWGQSADFVFNKDKEILAAEAKKATSKPARQPKIDPPKTVVEAQKQVDAAIAEGTPEAIEAARPAIEVLNPVGDDAAKVVEEMVAAAPSRAPKIEVPPEVAPEQISPERSWGDAVLDANAGKLDRGSIDAGKVDEIAASVLSPGALDDILTMNLKNKWASPATIDGAIDKYAISSRGMEYLGGPFPAAHGKSLLDLADDVYKTATDGEKEVLKKIRGVIPDGTYLADEGLQAQGRYTPGANLGVIVLRGGGAVTRTATHELVHSALVGLDKTKIAEIDSLMDIVRNEVRGGSLLNSLHPMMANPDEFIAYALTDADIQKTLSAIRIGDKTAWTAFVSAIRKILGIDAKFESALDRVLRVSDEAIEQRRSKLGGGRKADGVDPPVIVPEPVAPKTPKAKKPKTVLAPQEDPTHRPVLKIGSSRQEVPSTFDWGGDPYRYTGDMYAISTDPAFISELKSSQRSDLASKIRAVNNALEKRRGEVIEGTEITYGDLAQDAEEFFLDTPLLDALKDRSSVMVDEFLEQNDVSRADLEDAIAASTYSQEERAVVKRAIDALREDAPEIEKAQANEYTGADKEEIDAAAQAELDALVASGEVTRNPNALTEEDVRGWPKRNTKISVTNAKRGQKLYANPLDPALMKEAAKFAVDNIDEKVGFHTQRISDEFTQMTDEAMKRGGPDAAIKMKDLTDITRRMDDDVDKDVSRRMTEVNNALRKIPTFGVGLRSNSLDVITDVLNGEKVDLNDWQQDVHDMARSVYDELGEEGQKIYGFTPRKNYAPRIELRPVINSMIDNFRKQSAAKGIQKTLKAGPMTMEKARGVVAAFGKPADPAVARSIESQSTVLQNLFEKDEAGNVSLAKDEDGVTKLQREAAYLLLMPKDGSLEPMMPEFFNKVGQQNGVDKNGVPVFEGPFKVELKPNVKMPSPEDMKTLMDAEAMRILENREEYDPEGNVQNYHNSAGKWFVDGSLTHSRLMPDLGKEFYERNPINALVHTIRRQTRGLARTRYFGREKEILLDKLESLAPYFKEGELGLVKENGEYRLAEKGKDESKTEVPYKRSLLRSIEDIATGSSRAHDDSWLGNLSNAIEKYGRYAVLVGKLGPTAKNELMQLGASGMYGPAATAAYLSARSKVAAMQMESGLRQIGEKALRTGIGVADLTRSSKLPKKWMESGLDRMVEGDPISKADIRGMADASGIIGATAPERAIAGAMQLIGSFTSSNKAADIAAHYTGYSMFNDMIHRRSMDKKAFRSETGLLPDDLRRTMSEKDLDRAERLLDSQGWPKDAASAEAILELAGPFIAEFKSKLSGRSSPLFAPKIARQKWAKSVMWLMSIPMAITSGQIASIRRSIRKGNYGETALRATKLGAAGAGATLLSMLASQNPEDMAMTGALATGQYAAAGMAQALNDFDYNPEDEYANIEMASLKSDWDSDPTYGKLLNRLKIAAKLSGKSMWQPRFLDTRYASDDEMRVAGRRSLINAPAYDALKTVMPAADAVASNIANSVNELGLAGTAIQAGRKGDAMRMIAGALIPSVREGTGKLRADLRGEQAFQKQIDPEAIKEGVKVYEGSGIGDLIQSGVRTKINKIPGGK